VCAAPSQTHQRITALVVPNRPSVDVNDAEIWTMRYLGTQRRKISNSPDLDFRPTWGLRNGGRARSWPTRTRPGWWTGR
jgi:hypothetical protein